MKPLIFLSVLVASVILAACKPTIPTVSIPNEIVSTRVAPTKSLPTPNDGQTVQPEQPITAQVNQLPELTDNQGAVTVTVTPLELLDQRDELKFEVSMNTHSVDLGMDLGDLATLRTDTGLTVQADNWDAPGGGHHVSGTLSFPATVNGKPLLQSATQLTLTIKDVDAAQRIFSWILQK